MKRASLVVAAALAALAGSAGMANAATAAPRVTDNLGCPYTAICVWPDTNYQGTPQIFYACTTFPLDLFGPISYDNFQTPGTVAQIESGSSWGNLHAAHWAVPEFGNSKTYYDAIKPC